VAGVDDVFPTSTTARDVDGGVPLTSARSAAVTELMRIAWRSVGVIVTHTQADIDAPVDRLAGLVRTGIDEITYKRHHSVRRVHRSRL